MNHHVFCNNMARPKSNQGLCRLNFTLLALAVSHLGTPLPVHSLGRLGVLLPAPAFHHLGLLLLFRAGSQVEAVSFVFGMGRIDPGSSAPGFASLGVPLLTRSLARCDSSASAPQFSAMGSPLPLQTAIRADVSTLACGLS